MHFVAQSAALDARRTRITREVVTLARRRVLTAGLEGFTVEGLATAAGSYTVLTIGEGLDRRERT